jgi:hypothetical protein
MLLSAAPGGKVAKLRADLASGWLLDAGIFNFELPTRKGSAATDGN